MRMPSWSGTPSRLGCWDERFANDQRVCVCVCVCIGEIKRLCLLVRSDSPDI